MKLKMKILRNQIAFALASALFMLIPIIIIFFYNGDLGLFVVWGLTTTFFSAVLLTDKVGERLRKELTQKIKGKGD